jgi:predicted RNase H-like nuclease (RuvC/YqgF family)
MNKKKFMDFFKIPPEKMSDVVIASIPMKYIGFLEDHDREKDAEIEKLKNQIANLKAQIEQDNDEYNVLRADYKKVNELGLEPSYIKRAIKENEVLKTALELVLEDYYWADTEYYIGGKPTQEEYVKNNTEFYMQKAEEKLWLI